MPVLRSLREAAFLKWWLFSILETRILSAAVMGHECHQGIHFREICFAEQVATIALLRDQPGVHQLGYVVRKRGRWYAYSLPYLTNWATCIAVLNQDAVNGQSGRIPQRFKLFCCIFKLHERTIPSVVKHVNDISRIIELLTDNDAHRSGFPTLT